MAKKSENIFNECLERMLQGESIESCLSSYPEEAADLEPLLRTALGFSWRASSLQPRPEFKARARLRLEGAQPYAKQQRQPERAGFFAWQRGWAFALTAVLVILFAGAGTVAASSDSLPDEPLYPVKLATEQTRLAFAFSDTDKVELHTQLAENRAMEIAAMARQGNTEAVVIVTDKLAEHLEKASYAITKVEESEVKAPRFTAPPEEEAAEAPAPAAPPEEEAAEVPTPAAPPEEEAATTPEEAAAPEADAAGDERAGKARELKLALEKSTSRSLAALETALEQAPEQTKPALQRAIETIKKSHKKPQHEPGPEDEDEAEDKDKGKGADKAEDEDNDKDEAKPTPAKPKQDQPSAQKIKNKNNSKK